MRRPPEIMLFMIFVVAAASAMQASGLATEMGVQPDTGIDENVKDSKETLKDRSYTGELKGGRVNFVGLIKGGVVKVIDAFILVYGLYEMLVNVGVPGWVAAFLSSPLFLVVGGFIIHMMTGRRIFRSR